MGKKIGEHASLGGEDSKNNSIAMDTVSFKINYRTVFTLIALLCWSPLLPVQLCE